ncbi:MAG TPA: hypothetical protein VN777_00425 [Terriglobales bacterium]|nr:hypothetical protein [Terriglobales bacterium]
MRISGLLAVLLLVSVCGASDSMKRSASPQRAVNPVSSDWLDGSGIVASGIAASGIVRPDSLNLTASDRTDQNIRRSDSARDGDVTCYSIQDFLVKRESPHSDAVAPAGYSTCVPAAKYGVKVVGEPGKASTR